MLEEYEKSEIVNNAYMRRIMQVLENIKELRQTERMSSYRFSITCN